MSQTLQGIFLDLLVSEQIEDIGAPPSNMVAIKRLSARDRARLRSALETVQHLDLLTRDPYSKAEDWTAEGLGLADSVFDGSPSATLSLAQSPMLN